MAEGRVVRARVLAQSKRFTKISDMAQYFYVLLLTCLDIQGTHRNEPDLLKAMLWPRYDDDRHGIAAIEKYIKELADNEVIELYGIGERDYIYYPDFIEKQLFMSKRNESPVNPITPEIAANNEKQWAAKIRKPMPVIEEDAAISGVLSKWLAYHAKKLGQSERHKNIVFTDFNKKDLKGILAQVPPNVFLDGVKKYYDAYVKTDPDEITPSRILSRINQYV